jgi:hypothetical protein
MFVNLCFLGIFTAGVIDPADTDLIAGLATLEAERQVRVFGHGRTPFCHQDVLAVVLAIDFLDEMGRNDLAGFLVLAQAGFHRVLDQRLDRDGIALGFGADFNTVRHDMTP